MRYYGMLAEEERRLQEQAVVQALSGLRSFRLPRLLQATGLETLLAKHRGERVIDALLVHQSKKQLEAVWAILTAGPLASEREGTVLFSQLPTLEERYSGMLEQAARGEREALRSLKEYFDSREEGRKQRRQPGGMRMVNLEEHIIRADLEELLASPAGNSAVGDMRLSLVPRIIAAHFSNMASYDLAGFQAKFGGRYTVAGTYHSHISVGFKGPSSLDRDGSADCPVYVGAHSLGTSQTRVFSVFEGDEREVAVISHNPRRMRVSRERWIEPAMEVEKVGAHRYNVSVADKTGIAQVRLLLYLGNGALEMRTDIVDGTPPSHTFEFEDGTRGNAWVALMAFSRMGRAAGVTFYEGKATPVMNCSAK